MTKAADRKKRIDLSLWFQRITVYGGGAKIWLQDKESEGFYIKL